MGIPRLDKLHEKCIILNIAVPDNYRDWSKADYIAKLRAYHMPKGGLPYTEITPMLCFSETHLRQEEKDEMWSSYKWMAQRKINGCRAIVHFVRNVGIFVHTRTLSVKTWRFQDISEQFLFHDYIPSFDGTIDCEAVVDQAIDSRQGTSRGVETKSSLHSTVSLLHLEPEQSRKIQVEQDVPIRLYAFDCMNVRGISITDSFLGERLMSLNAMRSDIEHIMPAKLSSLFEFLPHTVLEKERMYQEVLQSGGEGIIMKNLFTPYITNSGRRRNHWVKIKKQIEYDAFVTGFKRGIPGTAWENMVGALEFSINTDGGNRVIAYCSAMSFQERQDITIYDEGTGEVVLDENMFGRVAEIVGQDISSRSLRISHAVISRWRYEEGPDYKVAGECYCTLDDLHQAANWVGS